MFLRDKQGWFWSLFIPLLIMSIFGLIDFGQMGRVDLGVVDAAQNEASRQLLSSFREVDVLNVQVGSGVELEKKIEEGDLDLLLVFPEDLSLLPQPPEKSTQVIPLFYNEGSAEEVGTGTLLIDQVLSRFAMKVSQVPPLFRLDRSPVDSRNLSYMDYMIPGIVGMMIMQLGIIGVAMIIVRYREDNILKRLRVTPVNLPQFLASLLSTRLLLLMIQVGLVILMGALFFDLHLYGGFLNIVVVALLGSLVFLSLGFTISGLASSTNTAMSLAQMIQMPMMFLSGVYFPRETLPDWLYRITEYLPLTYLADALRETMVNNASLWDVRLKIVPLVIWAIGGFFLAVQLFRWE